MTEKDMYKVREAVWEMLTPTDLDRVLNAIKQALQRMELPFYSCSLCVVEGNYIQFWATTGDGRWLKEAFEADDDHPILAFVQQARPVYRSDLELHDPYNEKDRVQAGYGRPIRCLLDVPYPMGTLSLSSLKADAFAPEHFVFLQGLSQHFGDAINRLKDLEKLKSRNQELEQLNYELDRFASVASHDLRAPLRRINQLAVTLKQHRVTPPDQTDRLIHQILDQTEGMGELVEQLLAYARAGRLDQELQPVSLAQAVVQAVDRLGAVIEEKQAQVRYGELPMVMGNETVLVQLLQNLIENGLKYQDETPQAEKDQAKQRPQIDITAQELEGRWQVSVQDNGIGIEADHLERIFEPFKRLHDPSQFSGSGLGLATCKRIVEHHKGKIWATSAPGQGTCFHFTLAAVLPSAVADASVQAPPSTTAPTRSLRILLADDDPVSLAVATAMLKRLGHQVVTASTGLAAWETYASEDHLDLLILDMHMPVWNGVEVTQKVRALEAKTGQRLPVFILSGTTKDEAAFFLSQGCDGLLTKPLDEGLLRQMMQKLDG